MVQIGGHTYIYLAFEQKTIIKCDFASLLLSRLSSDVQSFNFCLTGLHLGSLLDIASASHMTEKLLLSISMVDVHTICILYL